MWGGGTHLVGQASLQPRDITISILKILPTENYADRPTKYIEKCILHLSSHVENFISIVFKSFIYRSVTPILFYILFI